MSPPSRLAPRQVAGRDPSGAHPVKQDRSRQLRNKALGCARELVREGLYSRTSMADIARAVGCSVGALYSRFRNKESLFASVVELAMADEVDATRLRAEAGRYAGLPLRETVERCVHDFYHAVVGNHAMIRAMYQRSNEEPEYWNIVQAAAFEMVQIWVEAVAQAAGRSDRAFARQVGIAFQFVSSSLAHTVLIARQTRPMSEREHLFWLDEMVMHFIGLDVPEALRGTPVVRPTPAPVPMSATATAKAKPATASRRRVRDIE